MYGMPIAFTVLGIRADLQKFISEGSSDNTLLKTALEILKFSNSGTKATYEYVMNIFLKPGSLILTIAFSLIAIYLISGMIDNYLMMGRDIDMQVMIKMFCSLVIADILIEATPTIISYILGGSSWLLNKTVISINLAEAEKAAEDAANNPSVTAEGIFAAAGLLQLVGAAIWTALLKALGVIPAFGLKIILFSTQLEIVIRMIFAPIGLAGFANDSHRHEATRYLRKMIASGLYAMAIYITIFAVLKLSTAFTTTTNESTDILTWLTVNAGNRMVALAGPFAAIGAISTVKGIINEALGA